jgi:hypothetical protein
MGDLAAFLGMFGFGGSIIYLIFSVVRRKQQNAMQKHLLDKFSSTRDFTEFVQSPAGQKYVAGFSDAVTKPGASILTSVRIGIILIFGGLAFFLIRATPDAREGPYVLHGLGTLVSMLGLGFLVSGIASFVIAKRIKSEQAD